MFPMGDDLILLAGGAAFDVVCDPYVHSGPAKVVLGLSDCFIASQMSGSRVVMDFFHALPFLVFCRHDVMEGSS